MQYVLRYCFVFPGAFGNICEVQTFKNLVHEKTSNRSTITNVTNGIHNTYTEHVRKKNYADRNIGVNIEGLSTPSDDMD